MVGLRRLHPSVLALAAVVAACEPFNGIPPIHGGHHGDGTSSSGASSSSGSSSSSSSGASSSSSSGGGTGSSSGCSSSGGSGGVWGCGSSSSSSSSGGSVDNRAPTTTSSLTEQWSSGPVDVVLTCTDDRSGCAQTTYSVQTVGGTYGPFVYTGPISLTEPSILSWSSTDRAGNSSFTASYGIDVLPAGETPHLRVAAAFHELSASGGRLTGPGTLMLYDRMYALASHQIGDAAQASVSGGEVAAVTGAGRPLPVFLSSDAEAFAASGAPLGFTVDLSYDDRLTIFTGTRAVEGFPLHLATFGRTEATPDWYTLPAATLDIPDVPLLLDYAEGGPGESIRFTGSLLRGSAGPFTRLTVGGNGTNGPCWVTVPRDSAMLRLLPGASPWADVVEFTPAGEAAECLYRADIYDSSLSLDWEAPATSWFEVEPVLFWPWDRSFPLSVSLKRLVDAPAAPRPE